MVTLERVELAGDEKIWDAFFHRVFGNTIGYLALAAKPRDSGAFIERFFSYPDELPRAFAFIQERRPHSNVYFCAQLVREPRRVKEAIERCTCIWADLDDCPPTEMLVRPSITLETSPNRYQALWVLEEPVDPVEAEMVSKRIAYHHANEGSDRSGWDLTQYLRVPRTTNHKYGDLERPTVDIIDRNNALYRVTDFRPYPHITGVTFDTSDELPQLPDEPAEKLLRLFNGELPAYAWELWGTTPIQESWSEVLYKLEILLFEAGMTPEQVLKVCLEAKCNKYNRDSSYGPKQRQDPVGLWRDVQKAHHKYKEKQDALGMRFQELADLISDEELASIQDDRIFVDEYIEWAKKQTDAAEIYHIGGIFMLLSAIFSGQVRIPVTYADIIPNLWFMILGDTTLTRKSTAMDLATDLLIEIESDLLVANDGSIEGLLGALQGRAGQTSVFVRDEFAGMLTQMSRKDYYAGMVELFIKLYDGKSQKRLLRREEVYVKDPVFLLFTGGIKDAIFQQLTTDYVSSGFVPRFLFLIAETDTSQLRALGRRTRKTAEERAALLDKLFLLYRTYTQRQQIELGPTTAEGPPITFEAEMTDEAWERFGQLENRLNNDAMESANPALTTPTFQRLGISILKAATLIACTRKGNPTKDNQVIVTLNDLLHAIKFGVGWRDNALLVLQNTGQSKMENKVRAVLHTIRLNGTILKSTVTRNHHMSANEAKQVFDTLIARGQIAEKRVNNGLLVYAVGTD